jgi:hypothetical protein
LGPLSHAVASGGSEIVPPGYESSAKAIRAKKRFVRVSGKVLVIRLIEKGITTTPKPIDLSKYRAGTYSVQYLDPDGTIHNLGNATVTKPIQ